MKPQRWRRIDGLIVIAAHQTYPGQQAPAARGVLDLHAFMDDSVRLHFGAARSQSVRREPLWVVVRCVDTFGVRRRYRLRPRTSSIIRSLAASTEVGGSADVRAGADRNHFCAWPGSVGGARSNPLPYPLPTRANRKDDRLSASKQFLLLTSEA
jgi:hypothetical protein